MSKPHSTGKKICQVTCDYLCSKLDADNEDDKIIITQLRCLTDESITKLLAKDANELVKRLLQAKVINVTTLPIL